jgi:phage-related protein
VRRSTKVGIALGVVAVGLTVVGRPRERHPRPPVQRTLAVVALAIFAEWWNPVSWLSDLGTLAADSAQEIRNWVTIAVDEAFSLFDAAASITIGFIDDILSDIVGTIAVIGGMATTLVEQVAGIISSAIPNAINWVVGTVEGWARDAIGIVSLAVDGVISFFNGLINDVENEAKYVFDTYIAPAIQWIEGAADWVGAIIETAWNAFWAVAIAPVINVIDTISDQIDSLWNYLFGEARSVIDVVEQAWDWIVWFSEHTFDDIDQIIMSGESSIGASWVKSVAAGLDSQAAGVESMLERILGS